MHSNGTRAVSRDTCEKKWHVRMVTWHAQPWVILRDAWYDSRDRFPLSSKIADWISWYTGNLILLHLIDIQKMIWHTFSCPWRYFISGTLDARYRQQNIPEFLKTCLQKRLHWSLALQCSIFRHTLVVSCKLMGSVLQLISVWHTQYIILYTQVYGSMMAISCSRSALVLHTSCNKISDDVPTPRTHQAHQNIRFCTPQNLRIRNGIRRTVKHAYRLNAQVTDPSDKYYEYDQRPIILFDGEIWECISAEYNAGGQYTYIHTHIYRYELKLVIELVGA